jgi:alkylation response protein AidB-like acyl-CoA dehydrogenase
MSRGYGLTEVRELWYAASARSEGGDWGAGAFAAAVKRFAWDTAMLVITDAVQLLGGYSQPTTSRSSGSCDTRITQIYEGTNTIQRIVFTSELLSAR